ncbi:macro domain protein [Dictyocaulus viviparus]|uniref:Macro domain protein n=1 Tax=Dictyocaulus viviparus TaxID=29172 RepID=A0A0D8XPJ4_DICVI|nr:macro domain protein [Dictyocaulus viviparus]
MVTVLKEIPTLFDKFGVARDVLEKISLWRGDITRLQVDAIVNAANNQLRGGGGVDGAIHRAAGTPELQKECRAIGYCETGAAVITTGCNISHIKNIIHTVGPQCSGKIASSADREKLISCYRSCLDLAIKNNLNSIAFCCISTGVYGYPQEDAAKTVVLFLTDWLSKPENAIHIARIVLVLFNPVDVAAYEKFFTEYASSRNDAGAMSRKFSMNPYEVLGLERGCSDKDVQKAYKQQCLRWHPDKNLNNKEEAEKRFIAAKEAFQFLFDRSRRNEYDLDYEKNLHREKTQKARMEKADSVRKKLIEELYQRERGFVGRNNAEDELTSAQTQKRRKEQESRVRSEFETLRQRLEKEAADEIHAQQERLARLLKEQKESTLRQETPLLDKHSTLQIRWKPSNDSDYDEDKLRKIYGKYGSISTITPIRTTKKGDRLCMIEFDVNHEEWGAELETGDDGSAISGTWIIPPQSQSTDNRNKSDVDDSGKLKDYSSMTYEELQAQLFADMGPPRKKWHEED